MGGGPWLLAVESATPALGVALLHGEALRAELTLAGPRPPSETLLPAIDALLAHAGVGLAEVEAFAISIGPGSFTGLRVGLATVKGLAFDPARPVAAVCTLAALAAAAQPRPEAVGVLLDARRGEVYAAVFPGQEEDAEPLVPAGVYDPRELAARLPLPCVLLGDGLPVAEAALAELAPGARRLPASAGIPSAARVGRLGARRLARGEGVAAAELAPRYLRRAEAELRRAARTL